ncbi:uncharacterized protein [Amphiura filiformis]|uniref:uncharacterized protein isoform X3 n=1 Tax=Amphiura filiformis TaxID=82378 RepID=UPI003B228570
MYDVLVEPVIDTDGQGEESFDVGKPPLTFETIFAPTTEAATTDTATTESPCPDGYQQCNSGECIGEEFWCDSFADCADRSDELQCCPDTTFNCANGRCIERDQWCDGRRDNCRDNSDEDNCIDCTEDEYRCRTNVCISSDYKCDYVSDCEDNSDEIDGCVCDPETEFMCAGGGCINATWYCDSEEDCFDGSDEVNCTCSEDQFQCDNGECVPDSYRCDYVNDCGDNSDEVADCECDPEIEFECESGGCINGQWICDDEEDCYDGSDEIVCNATTMEPGTTAPPCPENQTRCGDGECIPSEFWCDDYADCEDRSDELMCCPDTQFNCANGRCIEWDQWCDGTSDDCRDNSDEDNCAECSEDEYRCRTNVCIPSEYRCDYVPDCEDNSDEIDECECDPEIEFSCASGGCVNITWQCDGEPDCFDYSDEAGNCTCLEDEFACEDGLLCIPEEYACDYVSDCYDYSDEIANCTCDLDSEFECDIGGCINGTWVCDGEEDCVDGSDESGCFSTETPTEAPTCPEGEFFCDDGMCIPKDWACDGVMDCPSGYDENEDFCATCPFQFFCSNARCTDLDNVCDGRDHCGDDSDETQICVELPSPTIGDVGSRSITFNWDEAPPQLDSNPQRTITEYAVTLSPQDGGPSQTFYAPAMADTEFKATGLKPETIYDIEIAPVIETEGQEDPEIYSSLGVAPMIAETIIAPTTEAGTTAPGTTETPCPENQSRCDDGECISSEFWCDSFADCSDRSDELMCCPETQFNCANGRCIEWDQWCDGTSDDCRDNSDEDNCAECTEDEYRCRTNVCIPSDYRCDWVADCEDNSDEMVDCECDSTVEFECTSGGCVNATWRCDGEADCFDGSDELSCDCPTDTTPCDDGLQCVPDAYRCDYIYDCSDNSDELNCTCENDEFECDGGGCVNGLWECDGESDCFDGSDENACGTEAPTCPPDEFFCDDGACVSKEWACDGFDDCADASDEDEDFCASCPFQFMCMNGLCTDPENVCDGRNQCRDNSDETQICDVELPPPTVGDIGGRSITLNWDDAPPTLDSIPPRNIAEYAVTLTPQDGGPSQTVYVPAEGDTSYTITGLQPETPYDVEIGAVVETEGQDEGVALDLGVPPFTFETITAQTTAESVTPAAGTTETPCPENQSRCDSGECIANEFWCDSFVDCADRSDELMCCPATQFNCANGRCIEWDQWCDGTSDDCRDNSDEDDCAECTEDEYRCRTNVCIPSDYRCDWVADCEDNSDEMVDCECNSTFEFNCTSGGCINATWQCDGEADCFDGSDELFCDCPSNTSLCDDGLQCVPDAYRCDYIYDCSDNSDELNCTCENDEFECDSGGCVNGTWECDGESDCFDGSDENDCGTEAPTCPPDEFFCDDGECVTKDWACDGFDDCADASDEDEDFCATCPFQFMCMNGLCTDPDNVCDGRNQCRDNSDETQICDVDIPSPTVGDIGGRSVTLNFNDAPPIDSNPPRNFTEYAVTLTPQDGGPSQTVYVPAEAGNYTITGLRPETPYDVEIGVVVETEGQDEGVAFDLGVPPFTFETITAPTTEAGTTESVTAAPTCPPDQFFCNDGPCIPKDWACDGFEDCFDASDEEEAFCATCPFQFMCTNGLCTDTDNVCDGRNQCRDNSDENQICDVELQSPSVGDIGGRSVTLNFDDAPPTLDSVPPRKIAEYAVTLTPQDGGPSQTVYVPAEAGNYTITGLQPETMYDVEIGAVIETDGQDEGVTLDLGVPPFTIETITAATTETATTDAATTLAGTTATPCPANYTRCNSGECIANEFWCDNFNDCADRSDELMCCPETQFNCANGRCIEWDQWCDGTSDDCRDNSDEDNCAECTEDEYRCRTNVCVPSDYRCDYFADCEDNSDEIDECECDPEIEFACTTGGCVNITWACDGEPDCFDESDEVNCTCAEDEFACADGLLCIPGDYACDYLFDCYDYSDEIANCTCDPEYEFECDSGGCINGTWVCDGEDDCLDGSDENACDSTEAPTGAPTCPPDEFMCDDGQCISKSWACDGIEDCSGGSDEDEEFCATCPFRFYCSNSRCTDLENVCDGSDDCRDNSDENQICAVELPSPTIGEVAPTSVTFNWDEPPPALESNPQRTITQYEITLTPQDGGPSQTVYVPAEADTSYTVSDLTPETMYDVEIAAVIETEGQEEPESYDLGIPPMLLETPMAVTTEAGTTPQSATTQAYTTEIPCPENQTRCDDGECIPSEFWCDDYADCADRSDELMCCPDTQFNCANGRCIEWDEWCDGANDDCRDNSDEDNCVECSDDEYRCRTNVCIPSDYQCDYLSDCEDNSDEIDGCECDPEIEFSCASGGCVNITWMCDGVPDCFDGSDEEGNCTCSEDQFACEDGTQCIPDYYACDYFYDCDDLSDEIQNCTCDPDYEFECDGGGCINSTWVCDGEEDCLDGSDESVCGTTEAPAPTCPPDEFLCADGETCVSKEWACDGFDDCADGSDEDEAFCATCPFKFFCSNGLCTDTDNVCDGRNQCRDNSDETQICDVELPSPSIVDVGGRSITLSVDEPPPALESNPARNIAQYAVTLTPQDGGPSQTVYVPAEAGNYTIPGLKPETMYDMETRAVIETEGQEEPESYDLGIPSQVFETLFAPTTAESSTTDYGGTEAPTCPPDEFFCADGETCISKDWACDGFEDCADGSDEDEDFCATCPFKFFCSNGLCTDPDNVCDGRNQCRDNSDETEICDVELPSPSVGDIGGRSVTLNFDDAPPTLDSEPPRNIPQYAVTLTPQDGGPSQTVYVPAEAGNYTITGLQPETLYDVEVTPVVETEGQPEPEVYNNLGMDPFTIETMTASATTEAGTTESVTAVTGTTDAPCPANQTRCADGLCIPSEYWCDGIEDCSDDELMCCPDTQFNCANGRCIEWDQWCDGTSDDCRDNSDEDNCAECTEDEYRCRTNVCIPSDYRCDYFADCEDNSDEIDECECDPEIEFSCASGGCVNITWWCDGEPDCFDGSDEVNCTCAEDEFACADGLLCIPGDYACDYLFDCYDYSDEIANCTCDPEYEFECDSGGCINGTWVCDGEEDCFDGSDESVCGTTESPGTEAPTCPPDEFFCADGTCVSKDYACDGIDDCTDGSDEDEDFCATCPFQFFCSNGLCIDTQDVCDGRNHCRDNSDETQICDVDVPSPSVADVGGRYVTLSVDEPPPALESNPARNIAQYAVTLTPQDGGPSQTVYVPAEAGNYTIPGLKPETMYDMETRAVIETEGQEEPESYDLGIPPQVFETLFAPTTDFIGTTETPGTEAPTCPPDEFFCDDGECVTKDWACDGFEDCADGSDEDEDFCATCPFQFFCANGLCIDTDNVCDGRNQCRDNSDETQICDLELPSPSVGDIGGRSVTLNFDDAPPIDSNPPRNFTEYAVTLTPQDGGPSQTVYVPAEAGNYTITGLQPETMYDVEVAPVIETEGQAEADVYDNLGVAPFTFETISAPTTEAGTTEMTGTTECAEDEYRCRTNECIPSEYQCDYIADCDDYSDEIDDCECDTEIEFSCVTGGCVNITWQCDGVPDCYDGSDEGGNCTCSEDQFTCANDSLCIPAEWRCDYIPDCEDNSDELMNCTCDPEYEFECGSGACINGTWVCDGEEDCLDGSDESMCGTTDTPGTEAPTCPPDEFFCDDGTCIPKDWACDLFADCASGSDEDEAFCDTCPFKFLCSNGRCTDAENVCDGINNCRDNSDEDQICDVELPSPSVGDIGGRSVTLSWDEPPPALESNPARNIAQYAVTLTPQDGGPSQTVYVPAEAGTNYTITGLTPETMYDIETRAVIETEGQEEPESYDLGIPPITVETVFAPTTAASTTSDPDYGTTESPCPKNQTRCDDGVCIPSEYWCDDYADCEDRSDELMCCPDTQFNCANGICIEWDLRCDDNDDCRDNSDEEGCAECAEDEYRCRTNVDVCIPNDYRCDYVADCEDYSDETDECECDPETEFACAEGGCVNATWVCDGDYDCFGELDASDELNCNCTEDQFLCVDSGVCIPAGYACDYVYDCFNYTDETMCTCDPEYEFECDGGGCINGTWVCDGDEDCFDGSDESVCGTTETPGTEAPTCPPDEFFCDDGTCVSKEWACDGFEDCSDASDEDEAFCATCPFKFFCSNGLCTDTDNVCDGRNQCRDNSDETQICDVELPSPTIGDIGGRSITLNFDDGPPTLDSNPQRNISQYAVTLTPQDGGPSQTVYVPAEAGNYTITGLEPETMYDVEVAAVVETEGQPEPEVYNNVAATPFTFETIFAPTTAASTTSDPDGYGTTESPCPENQTRCDDGECIPSEFWCDDYADCEDRSDELMCCPDTQFNCANGRCIEWDLRCDDNDDCRDNSDEEGCAECAEDEYRCRTNVDVCISNDYRCDYVADCEDSSDETDGCECDPETEFACAEGGCVNATWVCDWDYDCFGELDASDELNCNCTEDQFRCVDSGVCIPAGYACDYVYDCFNYTDETSCTCDPEYEFECDGGGCINSTWVCDGDEDCFDGSDESVCGTTEAPGTEAPTCQPDEFFCADGACVSKEWACDGFEDCADASDEDEAFCETCPFQFLCSNGLCTDTDNVCDGRNSCRDNSDETLICDVELPSPSVGDIGGRSVTLNFDDAPPTIDNYPGNITQYAVTLTPQDGGPSQTVYVPAEAGNYTITGLRPETMYDVEVAPVITTEGQEPNVYNNIGGTPFTFETIFAPTTAASTTSDPDGYGTTEYPCPENQTRCDDGECIPSEFWCDDYADCEDRSDELMCCPDTQFNCANGRCIEWDLRCDDNDDCRDNSDEEGCAECAEDEYRCRTNVDVCISNDYRCDYVADCEDSSDETDGCECDPETEFACAEGGCVNATWVCDWDYDCFGELDASDELNCNCTEDQFRCVDSGVCIPAGYACDYVYDCFNYTDETMCTCDPDYEFECDGGGCINGTWVCDGDEDCFDGSDESVCGTTETPGTEAPTCPPDEFFCADGACVSKEWACDGFEDCADASDEDEAFCETCPFQFLCSNGLCTDTDNVCDGRNSCRDNSDETLICDVELPSPSVGDIGGRSVTLNFDDAPPTIDNYPGNITQYAVTLTPQDGGPSQTVYVPAEADTNYTITGLRPETMYDVEVAPVIETEGQPEPNVYNNIGGTPFTFETIFAPTTVAGTTESVTGTVEPTCPPDEFFCDDGACVSKEWACDGFDDCADASDENEDFCASCPFQFMCTNGLCTDTDTVCDGRNNCRDNSDETQICDLELPSPTVGDIGGRSVTLNFDDGPPTIDSEPPRNIPQYAVTLTPQDGGPSQIVYVPAEAGNYTITGLQPETMYDVEVAPVIETEGQPEPEVYNNVAATPFTFETIFAPTTEAGTTESVTGTVGECESDEYMCNSTGECIPMDYRCDYLADCDDGSDETDGCECEPEIEFSCATGGCVNITWVCDGVPDCFDGSDEEGNCTCSDDQFTCANDSQCIPAEWRCDYIPDCEDNSDEIMNCTCDPEYEFECGSGACINGTWVCDGEEDCLDGSDESVCGTTETPGTEEPTCAPDEFMCDDGTCVFKDWACDGTSDCDDESDEDEAFCATCPFQFLCTNGRCTDTGNVCDGRNQCRDNSDETQICDVELPSPSVGDVEARSFTLNWDEPPPELTSTPARTITEYAVTVTPQDDGPSQTFYVPAEANTTLEISGLQPEMMYDIAIGAVIQTEGKEEPETYDFFGQQPLNVETNPAASTTESGTVESGTTEEPTCAPDEFMCDDGTCVFKDWACDGTSDCDDESDEDEAFCATCPFQFLCTNGRCTDTDNVCDGRNQCRDNSDETQICDVELPSPSVGDVGGSSFTLDWDEPPPELTSTPARTISEYAVTVTPQDGGPSQTLYVPAEAGATLEITDLEPETMYDIEIEAVIETEGKEEPETYDLGVPPLAVETGPSTGTVESTTEIGTTEASTTEEPTCPPDEFMCNDGTCVFKDWACDGTSDCDDESDEDEAFCATCPFQFLCTNGRCTDTDNVCDGRNQCRDNSDETQICDVDLPSPSVGDIGGSSLTLNWDEPPPQLTSTPARNITEYAVTVTPQDGGPSQTLYVPAEANTTLEITDLEPETMYDIEIAAVIQTEGQEEPETYDLGTPPLTVETIAAPTTVVGTEPGTTVEPGTTPTEECLSDQYTCNSTGECIPIDYQCDYVADCDDGSDEIEGCECDPEIEFSCAIGGCVNITWVCDGVPDCFDGSDELNCTCAEDEFACADGYLCIPAEWTCDYLPDCEDNSDEIANCTCDPEIEFECGSGGCINGTWVCDGVEDCFDGSDESECVTTETPVTANYTMEVTTEESTCDPEEFRCQNGSVACIDISWVCDRVPDCADGSDELGCCADDEIQCPNYRCVNLTDICDGNNDCGDFSDEENCGTTVTVETTTGYTCIASGTQIDVQPSWLCDGFADCDDMSDEMGCPNCQSYEFECDNTRCIRADFECNGRDDCRDNSDEAGCPP